MVDFSGPAAARPRVIDGHDHAGMIRVELAERGRPAPTAQSSVKSAGLLDVDDLISSAVHQMDGNG